MNFKLPLAICLTMIFGCGTDDGNPSTTTDNCVGGKCDGRTETVCDEFLVDRSGLGLESFSSINDTVTRFLMSGDSCPTTIAQAVEQANTEDVSFARSMFVTETAQLLGEPGGGYRAVTAIDINQSEFGANMGFGTSPVVFSMFGLQAGSALPQNAEVMAWDFTEGVFNYYEVKGGEWEFFGSSSDFAAKFDASVSSFEQYASDSRDVAGTEQRCAGCHQSGGFVMKELRSPWVHWEGDVETPGVDDFFDANQEVLGERSDGIDMESLTDSGNRALAQTRQSLALANGDLHTLLRPVFCDTESNVDSLGAEPEFFSAFNVSALFTGNRFFTFETVLLTEDQYLDAVKADGQKVVSGGQELDFDTFFRFSVPGPAGSDLVWIELLGGTSDFEFDPDTGEETLVETPGVVSLEFINAARAIDITRPVFSTERCSLMEFIPATLPELSPEAIQAAVVASLEQSIDAGTASSEVSDFHVLLKQPPSLPLMQSWINSTASACSARSASNPDAFVDDILTFGAGLRQKARTLPVYEFSGTMVQDNPSRLTRPDARLHPVTCELVDAYVSVSELKNPCEDDTPVCGSGEQLLICENGVPVEEEFCFTGCRTNNDGADNCVPEDENFCDGKQDGNHCDGNELQECSEEFGVRRSLCSSGCGGDPTTAACQ